MTDSVDVIRRLFTAFYSADEVAIREVIGPDFVTHAPGGGTGNADGWIAMAKQMAAGTPDNVTEINDIFACDDRVTVRYTCRGTQTGDLFGVPASNRALVTGGIEIYRFEANRVVECWGQYDMSQLFAQ